TALNKWFAYWLYDIDNDVMDELRVEIEHPDHSWEQMDEWLRNNATDQTFYLKADQNDQHDALSMEKGSSEETIEEVFTDDASIKVKELMKQPLETSDNRLAYLSVPLTETMHLSGAPELTIEAAFDAPAANLSAVLVDYG